MECVPNVSEGRDIRVVEELATAAGASLLDVHRDVDHHRSVFTLAGPGPRDAARAMEDLARAVATRVDLARHQGVHPRLGALDVVPFVALAGTDDATAADAARAFATWWSALADVPVFLYDGADPRQRTLPAVRRDAFSTRAPDFGPTAPHPQLGATAVGARRALVAVNCELAVHDVALARRIATRVRERDGGLPGVRALGLELGHRGRAQVSMNLVDLTRTGIEAACTEVERLARAEATTVARVELVGLLPRAELDRCSAMFLASAGISADDTIEARLAARAGEVRR